MGVIIARAVTLHAGGEDSGCVVGKPYLTGLGKSCPSSVRNRLRLDSFHRFLSAEDWVGLPALSGPQALA